MANEKGQLVVPDRHDEIEYLKPGYFQYLNKTIRKDSSRGYREWEVKTYGLYKSNKLLIADVPFERFFVGKHFIVGSQNPYRPEKCMLYNLAGKPVLSSIAGALYFDDGRDLGELGNLDPNVTLVSIFERHDRSNTVSIAVYDHKKQAIAYWLVKDAQNFKADERMFGATHAGFSYHDEKGYHQKIIRYKNGRFEVLDRNKISAKTMDSLNKARSNRADKWPGDIIGETDFEMPPVVEEGGPGYSNIKTDDNSFYQLYKDSLFFIKTGTRKHIEKPVGSSFVFLTGNATYQQLPIIVKQNGKYGITLSNESLQFPYDSLLYFGMHFIAGKKTTGGYKFGILDRFGKETVPFEYDSIIGDAWE
ncbi:MAG TPA: hypothetical protein VD905_15185, partial [Flavobacteriales bacterium]|nr:hypothetical protein [Flavobacteriales bacterium]